VRPEFGKQRVVTVFQHHFPEQFLSHHERGRGLRIEEFAVANPFDDAENFIVVLGIEHQGRALLRVSIGIGEIFKGDAITMLPHGLAPVLKNTVENFPQAPRVSLSVG
jgi:hypothetical protein